MKKLLSLLLFIAVCLAGCKKEDEPAGLVGKWVSTKIVNTVVWDGKVTESSFNGSIIQFNADGTGTANGMYADYTYREGGLSLPLSGEFRYSLMSPSLAIEFKNKGPRNYTSKVNRILSFNGNKEMVLIIKVDADGNTGIVTQEFYKKQ